MSIFDKNISEEKRKSLELAEDSREAEWVCPSFVAELFKGALRWDLIYPYPEQSSEDKKIGDDFLRSLENFLKANLDPDEVDRTGEIPQKVIDGLVQMGAFAMKIPQEYGGLGLSQVNYNRAIHLLATYCGSTAVMLSAHQSIGVPQPLKLFGTEEQKRKYLPRFRQGDISGFALTEPEAGSDPRLMKTTAIPTEDGNFYLINGEKLWCTNGNIADVLVVMAITPPKIIHGKERQQITAFIVETKTSGFEVAYRCNFMGLHGIKNGIIKFNNVKVPKENILWKTGEGLKLALITLNTGRLTVPAAVTGMGKWCLWVSRKWARERKQWGHSIGEHESIAMKLSFMAANTFAMDAIIWLASHMADNKNCDFRLEAAIAKLFSTEISWKIVDDALQIRGGSGYETGPSLRGRGKDGLAVERVLRDARINRIIEGTSEIMRLFIAREALDTHLKKIEPILSSRTNIFQKLNAAISMAIFYAFWYPKLWFPSKSVFKINKLPAPLNSHMRFVEYSSRRLARRIFNKMAIYQKKLESKQNILNRFVDIGADLFAMSAVCSYADGLFKKRTGKDNSLDLADLFCREARIRITRQFQDVSCNNDRLSNSIAKKLLAGEYEWFENDIIK
jgi:alkylation response protein AidB-like acyl-CoA dehydrogenase